MTNKEFFIQSTLNSIAAVTTITQTEHIFQIIQIVITCIAGAVSLAYTLWRWYRKAKADKKIDNKEIEEGLKTLNDGLDDLSKNLKEIDNDKDRR